jgi:7-cyano-7-deazaguanine synthase
MEILQRSNSLYSMRKIVMGLSGGMDSATLLGVFLGEGSEVHCCFFNYGSKHNKWEYQSHLDIVDFYEEEGFPIFRHEFDLEKVFKYFHSDLLMSGGEIPEGHYNDENMKRTVVPGRNLILSSIMAGLAESIGAEYVALGVHSGDHQIYPDCRPNFILSLESTIKYSTDDKVKVIAPFLTEDKTSILKIGYSSYPQIPYHLTRTCYKDQEFSCGKCGSCQERLEAFKNIGKIDPITYEL